MTYNPIQSVTITYSDGTQREARRCGLYPKTFASEDGCIFEVEESLQFHHNRSAAVSTGGRITPVKFLVADAWIPDWEAKGLTINLIDSSDPFNVKVSNLEVSERRNRGRPRGGAVLNELQLIEVARMIGSINETAEEMGIKPLAVARAILKWTPPAILEFDDVPEEIMKSTKYNNLAIRYSR